ncbi:MAG: class I SAM-dependent methyltransferase [Sulfurimonas sp.]|uniref:class I SAM-dependent methyltransferase n=1 Tax=Sulfurimonas sp. TaxID=2022749 RepID=UPI00261B47B4|nr:class I SAM-dependent methyltransferase [Sulfurimonas sp.]MDD5371923.1 class I SAM-dependent methyltransferase [Sulfurimonas sp.]
MRFYIHKIITKLMRLFLAFVNLSCKRKSCYICSKKFYRFFPYRGGSKFLTKYEKLLDLIGSDIDNFSCMYCGSNDRERHLHMYFDKLNIWDKMKNGVILHFAPEKTLEKKILSLNPAIYIKADLFPQDKTTKKMDATNIELTDNSVDIIVANHILEHILEYKKALNEFYRVLKTDGIAILQTPFSRLLSKNFEDSSINTDKLRKFFYGQEDHVRIFSEKELLNEISKAGFELKIVEHKELFSKQDAYYFGVNQNEYLIMGIKKVKLDKFSIS